MFCGVRMNEETVFIQEERRNRVKGGYIFREENHLSILFKKVSALKSPGKCACLGYEAYLLFCHIKEEF